MFLWITSLISLWKLQLLLWLCADCGCVCADAKLFTTPECGATVDPLVPGWVLAFLDVYSPCFFSLILESCRVGHGAKGMQSGGVCGQDRGRRSQAESWLQKTCHLRSACQLHCEPDERMRVSTRCFRVSPENKTSLWCFLYAGMEEDWYNDVQVVGVYAFLSLPLKEGFLFWAVFGILQLMCCLLMRECWKAPFVRTHQNAACPTASVYVTVSCNMQKIPCARPM